MRTALTGDTWLDPRQVAVTSDDRGPQINIVAWATMVFMILAVGTRLAIKYDALRRLGWDDGLVTAAMVRIIIHNLPIPNVEEDFILTKCILCVL